MQTTLERALLTNRQLAIEVIMATTLAVSESQQLNFEQTAIGYHCHHTLCMCAGSKSIALWSSYIILGSSSSRIW